MSGKTESLDGLRDNFPRDPSTKGLNVPASLYGNYLVVMTVIGL